MTLHLDVATVGAAYGDEDGDAGLVARLKRIGTVLQAPVLVWKY